MENVLIYFSGVFTFWVICFIENNFFDQDTTVGDAVVYSLLSWAMVVLYVLYGLYKLFISIKDKPFAKLPKKTKIDLDDKNWHLRKITKG